MVLLNGTLQNIDLTNPATHLQDMSPFWKKCREYESILWHPTPQNGFWIISRHADALEIYSNSAIFTVTRGNVLETLLNAADTASGAMLAVSDSERALQIRGHLRKLMSPILLQATIVSIKAQMIKCIHMMLNQDKVDFADAFAKVIPLATICSLLNIPESDRKFLLNYSSQSLSSTQAQNIPADAKIARSEILLYFAKKFKHGRLNPGNDLFSMFIGLMDSELALTYEEVISNCYSLLIGGNETTRLTMVGIIKVLAEQPTLWHALKSGQVDKALAIDELLRWLTPTLYGGRTLTMSYQFGHQCLKAGDIVTVWNQGVNFDDRVFIQPNELDLHRKPNRHLSLGYGSHYCLGAQLARMQLTAFLEVLADEVDEIHLCGEPKPIYSNFLYGFSSLPIKLIIN